MVTNKIPELSTLIFLGIILIGITVTVLKIKSASGEFSNRELTHICEMEDTLHFEGVITDYNGFGHKSTPIIFLLNDSLVKIPRYNTDFALYVGDTIKKVSGSHEYYIHRRNGQSFIAGKSIDTVFFKCR